MTNWKNSSCIRYQKYNKNVLLKMSACIIRTINWKQGQCVLLHNAKHPSKDKQTIATCSSEKLTLQVCVLGAHYIHIQW